MPHLVLVPGLGADERMFDPQRTAFPDLFVPPWLAPLRGESLPHYARRMAETVPRRSPLILGGVSMGGMLAWEMAPYLDPAAIVLIASCRTRQGIKRGLRLLRPLSYVFPAVAYEGSKVLARLLAGRIGQAGPEHRKVLISMYCQSDARRLRWACQAILAWQPRPDNVAPVYHIHGATDLVIPAAQVTADCLLGNGGHLINFSHAADVNRFLQSVVDRVQGSL